MGDLIGYARVSTAGQKLDIQESALTRVGVNEELIYKEKVSGTKLAGREVLEEMLSRGIRKGDTVVVTRLDRLARSSRDLHNISHILQQKSVGLKVIEQDIDTNTPSGRLFFTILGGIAEFETEIRKERQREGIDAALAKGADSPFRGRPPSIDAQLISTLRERGMTPTAIAKELGVARSSVYRYLNSDIM
jgi:DNA invertase Pin-like site-specific DNA recombinase